MLFKTAKIKDIITVLVLVVITGVFGYYYANIQARNILWLKTYPIRAKIAERKLSCSHNSPLWLAKILTYQANHGNAPANQIAYIDPQGRLHHCENGYVGEYPLISQPINEKTRFRYASVSKLWTSDVILGLIKQGRLSFDTKMVDILTEIDSPVDKRIKEITIADLLLHRAGFDRYSIFGQDMFGIGQDICPNHLKKMNAITLGFDPNTKMSYSNIGYCLLGEIASRVEHKPYTQLVVDSYRFDNTHFAFIGNHKMADEVDYNYIETGLTGFADIYTAFDYVGLAAAAGLSGNASELAKQVHMMAQKPAPNILSLDKVSDGCDMSVLDDCYGYAMVAYRVDSDKKTMYFRDGGLLGLSSLVAVGSKGDVVALLSNGQPPSAEQDIAIKKMIYQHLSQ